MKIVESYVSTGISRQADASLMNSACYLPLLVPVILFLVALYIPPTMVTDSGVGFLALRSMLEGGAFNTVIAPDPANIANDIATFQSWWSPGQYLVPGIFIWLGTNYGHALSLTALIATLMGVIGWVRVARSFDVNPFVLFVFVFGLVTFPYATLPFQRYTGGEVLLFAAAPWSLYAMLWAVGKPPVLCLAISLLSVALLFFAKLTGLVVFATNVLAISFLDVVSKRRLSSSIIAMWVASAIGAFCFLMFWLARGTVPASGSEFAFTWSAIWFSVSGVAFSGISGINLSWLFGHFLLGIAKFAVATKLLSNYVLGPLGLFLMVWVWLRLRDTRYRAMAVLLLTIVVLYAIAAAAMYMQGANISFEERHFRYAGILFFLLLLVAVDQWRVRSAKWLALVGVVVIGIYGLRSYVSDARELVRAGYYDAMSGISQNMVSPVVLEYMRSEITRHNFERSIAVLPSAAAAISLPRFRILYMPWYSSLEEIADRKWHGRAEKIFVVVQEDMLTNGKAEALLRSFVDYDPDGWSQLKMAGIVIYSQ